MFGDQDLDTMLSIDFGVAVVAGGVQAKGIFDEINEAPVAPDGRGEVFLRRYAVTVAVKDYPAGSLDIDQVVTVSGQEYFIRDHEFETDGALVKLLLRKKTAVAGAAAITVNGAAVLGAGIEINGAAVRGSGVTVNGG